MAESVFIAGLFVLACEEMAGIAEHCGDQAEVDKVQKSAAEMEKIVWAAGWDGEWFRRAYDDYGHVLGSKENVEGRIFIEPQGICVMAGLGVEQSGTRSKRSIRLENILPHRMGSFCSSLRSVNIICIWVRSPPIRLAIKRMRASSATPIRGS